MNWAGLNTFYPAKSLQHFVRKRKWERRMRKKRERKDKISFEEYKQNEEKGVYQEFNNKKYSKEEVLIINKFKRVLKILVLRKKILRLTEILFKDPNFKVPRQRIQLVKEFVNSESKKIKKFY